MGSTDPKGEGGARERMPSAADVTRIPQAVRDHALVMFRLGEAARAARRAWTDARASYHAATASEPGPAFSTIAAVTTDLWDAELAQEQGAAVYRAQLAENNARPVGERWSPTALALWARCSIAAQKPA